MMYQHKKAFSMVELIFIIVVLGILAKVGSGFIPDNRLLNDTNYILMKVREQQKNAIGYDTFFFGDSQYWKIPVRYSADFNQTCVESTKVFFERLDHDKSYVITALIENNSTWCFDNLGRPYTNILGTDQLLLKSVDINVSYNNKFNTISVLPMSGYVIIK